MRDDPNSRSVPQPDGILDRTLNDLLCPFCMKQFKAKRGQREHVKWCKRHVDAFEKSVIDWRRECGMIC